MVRGDLASRLSNAGKFMNECCGRGPGGPPFLKLPGALAAIEDPSLALLLLLLSGALVVGDVDGVWRGAEEHVRIGRWLEPHARDSSEAYAVLVANVKRSRVKACEVAGAPMRPRRALVTAVVRGARRK